MADTTPKVPLGMQYEVRVISHGFQKMSKDKPDSANCLSLKVEVVAKFDKITGAKTPLDTPVEDWINIPLTEKTMAPGKWGLEALKTLGMSGKFSDYDPAKEGHKKLAGTVFKAYYSKKPADKYPRWSIGVAPGAKSDPAVVRNLDNLFSLPAGGTKASTAPPPAQEAPKPANDVPPANDVQEHAGDAPADDDLPF